MEIVFAPLFSGSSGNSVYVSGGGCRLLADAGMSASRIKTELSKIPVDPASLNAIFVTHEHDDHIKGIGILARRYGIPVYATQGTWDGMRSKVGDIPPECVRTIVPGQDLYLKDMNIMPFSTPHDAGDSVGYTFSVGAASFTIATDIGCVKDSWLMHAYGSQAVLLESNYDPGMLLSGPYPYQLKCRIRSRTGHLSNDDAAQAALKLVKNGTTRIILGHLSDKNNFPDLALACCRNALEQSGYIIGKDVDITTANRSELTRVFRVDADLRTE